jgi:heme-degrading monooxygenase HmoA
VAQVELAGARGIRKGVDRDNLPRATVKPMTEDGRPRGATTTLAAPLLARFESVTGKLEQMEGFCHAYFLTNRERSRAMSITRWETGQALDASAERARQMRTATDPADATIESVERYGAMLTAKERPRVD